MRRQGFDTALSNGLKITITLTEIGFVVDGLDKMECSANGRFQEPYDSEIHHALLSAHRAITGEWGAPMQSAAAPPGSAEFLLILLATTRSAEAMIGDLNERFTDEYQKFGRDRAVRLHWARTLHSIRPLLWRAIGKVVVTTVKWFFGPTAA